MKRHDFNLTRPYESITVLLSDLFIGMNEYSDKVYDDDGNFVTFENSINTYFDPDHLFPKDIGNDKLTVEKLRDHLNEIVKMEKELVEVKDYGKFFYHFATSALSTVTSKHHREYCECIFGENECSTVSDLESVYGGITDYLSPKVTSIWDEFIKDHTNLYNDEDIKSYRKFNYLMDMKQRLSNFTEDSRTMKAFTAMNLLFYVIHGTLMKYFEDRYFYFINLDEDNEPSLQKQLNMLTEENRPVVQRLVKLCFTFNVLYEFISSYTGYSFKDPFINTITRIGRFSEESMKTIMVSKDYDSNKIDNEDFFAYLYFTKASNFKVKKSDTASWKDYLKKNTIDHSKTDMIVRNHGVPYGDANILAKLLDDKTLYTPPMIKKLKSFEKIDPVMDLSFGGSLTDIYDYLDASFKNVEIINPSWLARLAELNIAIKLFISKNEVPQVQEYMKICRYIDAMIYVFVKESDPDSIIGRILKKKAMGVVRPGYRTMPHKVILDNCEKEIQGILLRYMEAFEYLREQPENMVPDVSQFKDVAYMSRKDIYDLYVKVEDTSMENILRMINIGKFPVFVLALVEEIEKELKDITIDPETLMYYIKSLGGILKTEDINKAIDPNTMEMKLSYGSSTQELTQTEIETKESSLHPIYSLLGKHLLPIYYLEGPETQTPYQFFRKWSRI